MNVLFDKILMLNAAKRTSLIVACLAVLTVGLISAADDSAGKFDCITKEGGHTVVVGHDKNTTVWGIAENHCTGDIAAAQDALYEMYGLKIYPGQMIKLPKQKP